MANTKIRTPRTLDIARWREYIQAGGFKQMFRQKTAAVVTRFGLLVPAASGQFHWASANEIRAFKRFAAKRVK